MRISDSLERKNRRLSAGSTIGWLARAWQEALAVGPSVPVMFGAALVLGVFVLGLYQQQGLTLIYGDSAGHLYIARRTIESLTPSFAQLGGIWLPLPHVLMIPFVWQDTLWRTGLAGGIVSTLAFAAAVAYVYAFARGVCEHRLAAVLVAALFATNGNLLFMQTTAMTEPLTILTVVAATYHLQRWAHKDNLLELLISAVWVLAGTLVRYEMWAFVPAGALIVGFVGLQRRGWRGAEGLALAWAAVASYGIILWLIYSQVVFGDALNFVHGFGTGGKLAAEKAAQGLLPYKDHPLVAARVYGWSVIDTLGLPLVLVGCAGTAMLLISRGPWHVKFAALLPVTLFFFEVFSLTRGQSAMGTPHSDPPQFENARYGLLMLPAAVMLAAYVGSRFRAAGVVLLFAALLPQLIALPGVLHPVDTIRGESTMDLRQLASRWTRDNFPILRGDQQITLVDAALAGGIDQQEVDSGDWLRANKPNGRILISSTRNDAAILMMNSGLHVGDFVTEGNNPYFQDALRTPSNAAMIVYEPYSAVDALQPLFAEGPPQAFDLAFDNGQFQMYSKSVVDYSALPNGVPAAASTLSPGSSIGFTKLSRAVPESAEYIGYKLECSDGLMSLATTRRIFYAETDCSRLALDGWTLGGLTNVPLRVVLSDDDRHTLTISSPGVQFRASVGRAWSRSLKFVPSRPADVPYFATRVDAELTDTDGGTYYSLLCNDGLVSLSTTTQAIFAEVDCGENWPPTAETRRLLGLPEDIQIVAGDEDQRIIIIAGPGVDPIRVPAGRIWRAPVAPGGVAR